MSFIKKTASFILLLCILCSLFTPVMAFSGVDIDILAEGAILVDMETGDVLYEKNAYEKMYPASLTKMMTVLLAIELGDPASEVTASKNALTQGMSIYGSNQGILEGETMTLENYIYTAFISSANEACNVIAEHIAGTIEDFVVLMNERAAAIGCTGTHFANPHGLHDENHYTCPADVALIAREAMKNDTFANLCSIKSITIPASNMSEERHLYTTNYLISNETVGGYVYEYARGIKTGFTTPAGYCLASSASNGAMELIGVIMGADSFEEDGVNKIQSFVQMKELFKWGFENFSLQSIVSTTLPVAQVQVKFGATTNFVLAYPAEQIYKLLPNGFNIDSVVKEVRVFNEGSIEAPVSKGDILGELDLFIEGKLMGTVPILALTDVERSGAEAAASGIKAFFASKPVKITGRIILVLFILFVLYLLLCAWSRHKARTQGRYTGRARRRRR